MALPPRLKSAVKPFAKLAAAITPTGIGVLFSVGAHGALLAFAPQTNFSFAALSQAAQEADAEETIVPLVDLSPAERGRLPEFAQPRRKPPSLTGLSSLTLPPGISPLNNQTRIQRRPKTAGSIPSPTPKKLPAGKLPSIGKAIPNYTASNFWKNSGISSQPAPSPSASSTSGSTYISLDKLPPPPGNATLAPDDSSVSIDDPLPTLESGFDPNNTVTAAQALAGLEARGSSESIPTPEEPPEKVIPQIPTGEPEEKGQSIDIPAGPLDMATAQKDGSQIIEDSLAYSDAVVSETAVEQRKEEWYAETSEGKEQLAQATSELSVPSGFKACREKPPTNGLIGVLVNPDGSQENATILQSSGYDIVNRSAMSRLAYEDFGEPEFPTQYEIEMKVIYEPENCTDILIEAAPEE